jgi:asparagine synthase (glutamine-hydrolysing)
VIRLGEEFLSRFAHYAERTVFVTDGCVDLTYSPDFYLNQKARDIAPVRLTGNYGGEVLRQIVAFKPIELAPGLFSTEFLPHLRAAHETYSDSRRCHPLSFALFRQAPWHHYGLLSLEESQLSLRSPYLDNELVQTVYRAPISAAGDDHLCLRLIRDGNRELCKIRTDRGEIRNGHSRHLAASIQRNLLEFTFKAEYAYDYGMPQWVARIDHLLAPLRLERLFLGRHKFHHFRIWYQRALAKYVQEMLLDRRSLSRPYLKPKMVQSIVHHHLRGDRNYTVEIHKLLTLELIHRLFLDPVNALPVSSAMS